MPINQVLEEVHGVPQATPVVPTPSSNEAFFLQNLKKVLGAAEGYLQKIKVSKNVMTIITKYLIVRRECNLPDGYYQISSRNEFYPVAPKLDNGWDFKPFPDPDFYTPEFNKLMTFAEVPREQLVEYLKLANQALSCDVQTVTFHQEGLSYIGVVDTGMPQEFLTPYPMRVPHILVPFSRFLVLALNELIRYDTVKFSILPDSVSQPVIIGKNWSNCVMLAAVNNTASPYSSMPRFV